MPETATIEDVRLAVHPSERDAVEAFLRLLRENPPATRAANAEPTERASRDA
jgi:hypothetical protein